MELTKLTKLTKNELIDMCNNLGFTRCKSKNKSELILLINSKNEDNNEIKLHFEENKEQSDEIDNIIAYDNNNETKTIENITYITCNDNTIYDDNGIFTTNKYEKEEEYMKSFLKSIRNKNGTYKRICISPLRYAGGKSKAIGIILDNLPKLKEKKIVSPFFGGGSVELCLSQMLGIEVIGYDIFNMLVNFWNVLIYHKDEFIDKLIKLEINEEQFTYNRHILLNYWEKIKPANLIYKTKNKIQLKIEDENLLDNDIIAQAVYYYYNMTLSYGPMFLGWPSSNEINKDKFDRRIEKLKQLNLKNLHVKCESFQNIIEKHNDDFLFLDPPYYLEGDSKMFKGMYPNCNFAIHHNQFDHIKLSELLKKHKGGFLMTYNNCSAVRKLYEDYTFEYPEWQYTYGQGETRIGKNRLQSTNDHIKESHEIIIIKWPEY